MKKSLAAALILILIILKSNTVTFGELAEKTYILHSPARTYSTWQKASQKESSDKYAPSGSYRILKEEKEMYLISSKEKSEFWINPKEADGTHGSPENTEIPQNEGEDR